jgi:hypothetical protein
MLDLNELREAIRNMTRQQGIYKVLRDELTAKGYWRKLPRGNPGAGRRKMLEKKGGLFPDV